MTQTMNISRLEMETTNMGHLTCQTDDMNIEISYCQTQMCNTTLDMYC